MGWKPQSWSWFPDDAGAQLTRYALTSQEEYILPTSQAGEVLLFEYSTMCQGTRNAIG